LSLVVDCANGAASDLAPVLFRRLGAKVVAINNRPNGKNINQDSGSLHLEGLRQKTISENADLGVAFDGDADRALFINSDGDTIDGDGTLLVLANHFLARGQLNGRLVVATVMSNVGLEIALRSQGITLRRTDVGDKYVLDELLRLNASLGGEQSGHVIIPRLSLAGDGMITTVSLLRALQDAGKSLQELTSGFERYPQILVNVKVREKRPFSEIEEVQKITTEIEQALTGRGRLLLRYSGTEPLARIMIEGQDRAEIEGYGARLASALEQVLGTG
jgi:phosphoglucosamine mutase